MSGIPAIRNSMVAGVYLIRNTVNGKQYIGASCELVTRFGSHLRALRHGTHRSAALQKDWALFGPDAFEFRLLLVCSLKMLLFYEQRCLDTMPCEYNSSKIAGIAKGFKWSDEARQRMSVRRKTIPPSPKQLEHIRNMAKRRIGQPGYKKTIEQRQRQAAALRGRKQPPDLVEKRAAKLRGVPKTPEHRAKLSAAAFRRHARTK